MARIRSIKPEFWRDEEMSALPPETHLLAAALLNYADDEGYFNANPRLIQGQVVPLREDSTSIRRSLDLLEEIGYIKIGVEVDRGRCYGHITHFTDHQRIDRPTESKIKNLDISWRDSTKPRRGLNEESSLEQGTGNREQGTGNREKEGKPHRGDGATRPQVPYQQIVDLYHEILPELRAVRKLTAARSKSLAARWKEDPKRQNLDWWRQYFELVRECPFLLGHGPPNPQSPEAKPWAADFEFLISERGMVRTLEGKYAN